MKLILLRHGESQWNLENRFTGWKDVQLTKNGIKEAEFAANQIQLEKIKIHSLYTSLLKRATHTSEIVANKICFKMEKIQYDWRLNERHYGALQGLNKSQTAEKYGEDQVHVWRRSFDIPPPTLTFDDPRHPKLNEKFKSIDSELPVGESLKNVIDRLDPFWTFYKNNIMNRFENNLIVAHSNSLRAIIKIVENLSDKEIISVNLPTGIPLVYEIDHKLKIINKKFLIEQSALKNLEQKILDQGKA
jgi:2,3-bisphosphoglycerate-dependent phosphoglycerate mutase